MSPHVLLECVPTGQPGQPLALSEQRGYFVSGSGAPVVMLHASLSSKSQWTPLAQRLASRYRVIAVDLAGYGDQAMPSRPETFSLDTEVDLVESRLRRVVAPGTPVHLVGHSYGGLVALRFALRHRNRLASLSLYEPVAFRLLDQHDPELAATEQMARRISELLNAGRRAEATRTFVDFWGGSGAYIALPPATRESIERRCDKVPLDFKAAWAWPMTSSELGAIDTPTLLMLGHHSPRVTHNIHGTLTRILPNRSIGLFDAGHMGPISDAYRVNRWIESFIDLCASRDTRTLDPIAEGTQALAIR
ncbi:MAG TPA: alpha/beta fold hydrolase [Casimicrobiaceae bacterium]|nr:alpha/beta fold hydrolase [Casimicrobiaceae bacterium]